MTKIIHLSDLHIGAEKSALPRTKRIVERIISLTKQNRQEYLVVITGDLVERAGNQIFQETKEQIDRLKAKDLEVFIVPGNHDYLASSYDLPVIGKVPVLGSFPWISLSHKRIEQFNKIFVNPNFNQKEETYPVLREYQDCFLIGLDSQYGEYTRNSYEVFWNADGSISEQQLANLKKLLLSLEAKNKKKILCLHHHPVETGPFHATLSDYRELQNLLKEHPVDLVLFGHKHASQEFVLFERILCYNAGSSTGVRKGFSEKEWEEEAKIRIFDLGATNLRDFSYLDLKK